MPQQQLDYRTEPRRRSPLRVILYVAVVSFALLAFVLHRAEFEPYSPRTPPNIYLFGTQERAMIREGQWVSIGVAAGCASLLLVGVGRRRVAA